MNLRNVLAILSAVVIISTLANAEAKTVNTSELYTDIWLYGGESLLIFNDLGTPRTFTTSNSTLLSFDSGEISPKGSHHTGGLFSKDGDYPFHDSLNPNNKGVIHVRINEKPLASLDAGIQHEAGSLVTLRGSNFEPNARVELNVIRPNGDLYTFLTVFATESGDLSIPLQTQRTDQNGVYKVYIVGGDGKAITSFVINGGVTPENPLVVAPITNSTIPEFEQQVIQQQPTQQSTVQSQQPIIQQTPQESITTSDIVNADKTELLRIIAQLLKIIAEG